MLNILSKALQSAHIINKEEVGATTTKSGINVNIQTDALRKVLGSYWGWVEHTVNDIPVPDLILPSDETMYAKKNNFSMYQPVDKFYLVNDVDNDRFCLHAYDLNAKFITEDFHLHKGALGAHGAAHVTMDHTYLGQCYHFITQTLPDGRQVPGTG